MQKIHHKKSLGQHFIKDSNLHKKIVSRAGEIENFNIIEIGPGDGGLSKAILEKNPKKLVMIEKDKDLIPHLTNLFSNFENIEIKEGDATAIDLKDVFQNNVKIIANLPYNVATKMILNWLSYVNFFTSITVLIQKEVAERFIAKIGDNHYGRTAILSHLVSNVKKEFDIPPGAFNPPPKVDSTLITFVPLKDKKFDLDFEKFARFLKVAFSQPRKTIFNNLKHDIENLESVLESINLKKLKRPEEIPLEEFVELYERSNFA